MQSLHPSPTVELQGTASGLITTTNFGERSTLTYDPDSHTLIWTFVGVDPMLRMAVISLSPRVIYEAAIEAGILTRCQTSKTYFQFDRPAGVNCEDLTQLQAPNSYMLRTGAKLQMQEGTHVCLPTHAELEITDVTPHRQLKQHHLMRLTAHIGETARFDAKLPFAFMLYAMTSLRAIEAIACPPDGSVVVRIVRHAH